MVSKMLQVLPDTLAPYFVVADCILQNGYTIISCPMHTSYNMTITFLHQKGGSLFSPLRYGTVLATCFS